MSSEQHGWPLKSKREYVSRQIAKLASLTPSEDTERQERGSPAITYKDPDEQWLSMTDVPAKNHDNFGGFNKDELMSIAEKLPEEFDDTIYTSQFICRLMDYFRQCHYAVPIHHAIRVLPDSKDPSGALDYMYYYQELHDDFSRNKILNTTIAPPTRAHLSQQMLV
jgi:hypothetical protein